MGLKNSGNCAGVLMGISDYEIKRMLLPIEQPVTAIEASLPYSFI